MTLNSKDSFEMIGDDLKIRSFLIDHDPDFTAI